MSVPIRDKMMQGRPAGQFDEHTLDTIKSILCDHDETSTMMNDTRPATAPRPEAQPCAMEPEATFRLTPVRDVQPLPKLSAQAVLDAEEAALHASDAELAVADWAVHTPAPASQATSVAQAAPEAAPEPVSPTLAEMAEAPESDLPDPSAARSAEDIAAELVRQDRTRRRHSPRAAKAPRRGLARRVVSPFAATTRSVMRGGTGTFGAVTRGVRATLAGLARLRDALEPHVTRKRVVFLALFALFALRPVLMTLLALLVVIGFAWAFVARGPDRVWFGIFRAIRWYANLNSTDAALLRDRFDRFARRWNRAAEFLPEDAGHAIAVPDFEALAERDRAHEAAYAQRLQRMTREA